MLTLPRGDRDCENAREWFHDVLMNAINKDRETDTKSGLPAAPRKRKLAMDNSVKEAETSTTRPMAAPLETM